MGGESGGAPTTTKLVVTAAVVGAGALAYYRYTNKLYSFNAETKSDDAMEAAAAAGAHTHTEAFPAAAAAATPTGTSLAGNAAGPLPPRTMEELKSLTMEELKSLTVEELKSLDAQMSRHASSHDGENVAAVEQRVTDVVLRTSATAPARAALAAADAAKAGWRWMTVSKPALKSCLLFSALEST